MCVYLCVLYVCNILLLLYSFICGWCLGCFQVLAVVNSVAVNSGVHVSVQIRVSSECITGASQMVQWWRICLPVREMLETWVQSLGREDPLEEEMATQSSNLAWKILWTEGPVDVSLWGHRRVRHDWATKRTHMGYMPKRGIAGWYGNPIFSFFKESP